MKFLNYDKVLCLSPHPDDVEYGMLGTMMKYKDTKFDIIVLLSHLASSDEKKNKYNKFQNHNFNSSFK